VKNLLVSAAALVALIVAAGIGNLASRAAVDRGGDPLLEKANLATREINKSLPMMIDRATRLDITVADRTKDGARVTYQYTLLELTASDVPTVDVGALRSRVVATTCAQRDANLLAKGISMGFSYAANDATFVTSFDVRPGDCIKESAGASSQTRTQIFRSRATGELFERTPDGTYKPYLGDPSKITPLTTTRGGTSEANHASEAPILSSKALHCFLDELPGVQSDMAAQAVARQCKERYPSNRSLVESERGWFAAYSSADECLADKGKLTPSDFAVRALAIACQRLYGQGRR
jgi:hypothetical protein